MYSVLQKVQNLDLSCTNFDSFMAHAQNDSSEYVQLLHKCHTVKYNLF